jgi:crotonobetainyl-CoA:carnitine CoA-transferase CaiB-like acyl-CoA transferase
VTGLLDGLRVLDFSLWQPGHYATQLLGDLGAIVVKVEPPGGDRMRVLPDRFVNFNGHKRSVVLDLKQPAGRARALELAALAEVAVEGYRPGVAAALGVGYEALSAVNPALVYCSISGFGQDGPLARETGHDLNYQAYAGALRHEGHGGPAGEPVPSDVLVADQGSGMTAAFAILAAVLCARRTGEGERIDVSMADVVAGWVAPAGPIDERRAATAAPIASPASGVFPTAGGGYIVLGIFTEDHFWDALCRALGLDQFVGLGVAERTGRVDELHAAVASALLARRRDEAVELLSGEGVPVAPVLSRREMLDHPHFWARGLYRTGPDGGRVLAHPVVYGRHPAAPPGSPPGLGEHDGVGFG